MDKGGPTYTLVVNIGVSRVPYGKSREGLQQPPSEDLLQKYLRRTRVKRAIITQRKFEMDKILWHILNSVLFEWLIRLLCMKRDPSLRNVQWPSSRLRNTSLVCTVACLNSAPTSTLTLKCLSYFSLPFVHKGGGFTWTHSFLVLFHRKFGTKLAPYLYTPKTTINQQQEH